jgi:polyisoprenoid-binding protein YceI
MCWENSLRSPASWKRDENDVTKSKIRASIDADTINTREPQRDAHLKSADFFHVEKHPALTFNSTVISKNADGELKVSGDLTIRGVIPAARDC